MIRGDLNEQQVAELDRRFDHHPPLRVETVNAHSTIRLTAKDFGAWILMICPYSREQALAMTALEEAAMWAHAAIARNEDPQ